VGNEPIAASGHHWCAAAFRDFHILAQATFIFQPFQPAYQAKLLALAATMSTKTLARHLSSNSIAIAPA